MMTKQEVKALTGPVEGWLYEGEGALLYDLAKACTGSGVIVEIGSWKGKSTIWLAKGSEAGIGVPVYAIDPHIGSEEHHLSLGDVNTFKEFEANIRQAGVESIVKPIVKPSAEAAAEFREPVELIFIDGAHDYDSVRQDFELWYPKVIDGGIMAFHDTIGWEGPRRLVAEEIFCSNYFRKPWFVFATTYARKVGENTAADRARNRATLVLKNLYEPLLLLATREPVKRLIKKFV